MTVLAHPATWLAGYIPDLPTPFDEADRIDLAAFARLCERQIEAGVSAIVVGETAGEAATLTPAEHDCIVRAAVGIARGRARVIAGAGSNSTSQAIELTRRAEAAGADAVLSVVPYYNKPMQSGIDAHFQAIAEADHAAHHPARHSLPHRPRTHPTIRWRGWRDRNNSSACGMRPAISRVRCACARSSRRGFGCCRVTTRPRSPSLPMAGTAAISTISNVAPDLCQAIFSSCRQGRLQTARYLQSRLGPLTAALSKESPAALKYALSLLGFMSPGTRLPIVELDACAKAEVASAIAAIGDEDLACPCESWPVGDLKQGHFSRGNRPL